MVMVLRLPENTKGRDFILGDVHGSFELVIEAMKKVNFDQSKDRLFSVGDLVDRGPESHRALSFLAQSWTYAVRGNHEQMFIDLYSDTDPDPAVIEFVTSRNGMSWWNGLSAESQSKYIEAFQKMPVAIEVQTCRGTVGIIHGEVPKDMTWREYLCRLESNDKELMQQSLWSRSRVNGDDYGVLGVGRIFAGHTPQESPKRRGNVFYIDTGAVFGLADGEDDGRLTFADINCSTVILTASQTQSRVDVRQDKITPQNSFGKYAR